MLLGHRGSQSGHLYPTAAWPQSAGAGFCGGRGHCLNCRRGHYLDLFVHSYWVAVFKGIRALFIKVMDDGCLCFCDLSLALALARSLSLSSSLCSLQVDLCSKAGHLTSKCST